MLDEDGATVVATIEGTDTYDWLGPTVVHRADVMMGDRHTRSLEVIEPYDADLGAFPTRAYDDEGVWTFRAAGAHSTLRIADDGSSMEGRWVIHLKDGGERPWMPMTFVRQ